MELQAGNIVDRYVVLGHLGSGGMADVYMVQHRVLGTRHALKVLHVAGSRVRRRIFQEGQLQGRLRNAHVVSVTDMIDVSGVPALVMDLVYGPSLDTWLNNYSPTPDQIDLIARGILRGLASAHSIRMIHRDLKPSNVMLDLHEGQVIAKLTDFGLARNEDTMGDRITRTGISMGTPGYMAPEQARNARAADARSDVFSVGALLYELLTGREAFEGEDLIELAQKTSEGDYAPIDPNSRLPPRMVSAVEAALQPDPADRPADASALLQLWCSDVPDPDPTATWDFAALQHVRDGGEHLREEEEFAFETPANLGEVLHQTSSHAPSANHWTNRDGRQARDPLVPSQQPPSRPILPIMALVVFLFAIMMTRTTTSFVDPTAMHTQATPKARKNFAEAVSSLRRGQLAEAYEAAREAASLAPMDLGPYTVLRAIHTLSGRGTPETFAQDEAAAIRAAPAHLARRTLLMEIRRLDRGGEAADAARERLLDWHREHPEDDVGQATLVHILQASDQHPRRATTALAVLHQAQLRLRGGDTEGAIGIMRQGISLHQKAPALRRAYLRILRQSRRLEDAMDVLRALPDAMRERPDIRAEEVVLLMQRGNLQRAGDLADGILPDTVMPEERVVVADMIRSAYTALGLRARATLYYQALREELAALRDAPRLAALQREQEDLLLLSGEPLELTELSSWETHVVDLRTQRPAWRVRSEFRDAVIAAWSGRPDEAERKLAVLEAEDQGTLRDRLALEIAAVRRHPERLRGAARQVRDCPDRARAAWLMSDGTPDHAIQEVLEDTVGSCGTTAEAAARVALARLARATDNPEAVRKQTRALRLIWPLDSENGSLHESVSQTLTKPSP